MRPYKWIDKRIAELDPETDYNEIVRINGAYQLNEFLLNIGYSLAFMAVSMPPQGAHALHSTQKAIDQGQRRFEHTLTLVWTWNLCPGTDLARRSLVSVNSIHRNASNKQGVPGRFGHNEDFVSGMAVVGVGGHRLQQAGGQPGFSPAMRIAYHHWARDICLQLTTEGDVPVVGFPDTFEEMQRQADTFEAKPWDRSREVHEVGEGFIAQFCERWFPRPLRGVGRQLLLTVMPDNMRTVMQFEQPHPVGRVLIKAGLRALFTVIRLLPDPQTAIYERPIRERDTPALRQWKEDAQRLRDGADVEEVTRVSVSG